MRPPSTDTGNVITFPIERGDVSSDKKGGVDGIIQGRRVKVSNSTPVRGGQSNGKPRRKRKKDPLMNPNNGVWCGGHRVYADKPFVSVRPRPASPELKMFYIEEEKLAEREAWLIWHRD